MIMVGEMRDAETAHIGVHASLTGHLVLTTLHTNTAAGAITRLIDMEIESFLLASSVRVIVGQRLVRILCEHCKQPHPITAADLRRTSGTQPWDSLSVTSFTSPKAVTGALSPAFADEKVCLR